MPKRSRKEKLEHYNRKIKKLMERIEEENQEYDPRSVDELEEANETHVSYYQGFWDESEHVKSPVEALVAEESLNDAPVVVSVVSTQEPAALTTAVAENTPSAPSLEPDILAALGESTDPGPTFGEEIHEKLCNLWQPLLKKGMTREARETIMKEYLVPSNCSLLQAPKLNIEISAAVNELTRLRDKKVETAQQQLGIGITAVSRALTSLINPSGNKVEVIKILSDACRILCDLHHNETMSRIKMLTPGLTKPFLAVIQDSDRDETLFGSNLSEKIKASKTIEKQGMQIKKNALTQKMPQGSTTQRRPSSFQGNWAGPSRYPTNRGGRGGPRRPPPAPAAARRPPLTATAHQSGKPSQSRTRAPPRH